MVPIFWMVALAVFPTAVGAELIIVMQRVNIPTFGSVASLDFFCALPADPIMDILFVAELGSIFEHCCPKPSGKDSPHLLISTVLCKNAVRHATIKHKQPGQSRPKEKRDTRLRGKMVWAKMVADEGHPGPADLSATPDSCPPKPWPKCQRRKVTSNKVADC